MLSIKRRENVRTSRKTGDEIGNVALAKKYFYGRGSGKLGNYTRRGRPD